MPNAAVSLLQGLDVRTASNILRTSCVRRCNSLLALSPSSLTRALRHFHPAAIARRRIDGEPRLRSVRAIFPRGVVYDCVCFSLGTPFAKWFSRPCSILDVGLGAISMRHGRSQETKTCRFQMCRAPLEKGARPQYRPPPVSTIHDLPAWATPAELRAKFQSLVGYTAFHRSRLLI